MEAAVVYLSTDYNKNVCNVYIGLVYYSRFVHNSTANTLMNEKIHKHERDRKNKNRIVMALINLSRRTIN